jgi:hypothetical protein
MAAPLRRVRGNAGFSDLKAQLRQIPISLAHDVAQRAAPTTTRLTQVAYATGKQVYGEARPLGDNGNKLDLRKSGLTQRTLRFVASGTIVRCVLGAPYMKYLIGKYKVLPNNAIPAEWDRALHALVTAAKVNL